MSGTRDRIRMSDEEIRDFLEEPHKLQLATINPDGTPHLVAMYYGIVDGRIAFWTYRTSQKAVNLRRDPRLTVLVETGEGYDQLRGVSITGTVESTSEFDRVRRVGEAVYGRYLDGLRIPDELLGPYLDHQASKRDAFLVSPQRTRSWDHRKLATAETAAGR